MQQSAIIDLQYISGCIYFSWWYLGISHFSLTHPPTLPIYAGSVRSRSTSTACNFMRKPERTKTLAQWTSHGLAGDTLRCHPHGWPENPRTLKWTFLARKITDKWSVFHCHVWLLEGSDGTNPARFAPVNRCAQHGHCFFFGSPHPSWCRISKHPQYVIDHW